MTRDAEASISLRGFTRRYGDRVILRDLDLDIAPGELVALVGRSGSGKTTLLRALAGLDPVEGDAVRVPQSRAVVFQDARLLPWKRVIRNVALGLRGERVMARAEAALAEVELTHRVDAWPLTLSGGEAQRVALARALVREPKLLLLDEPFAALDALTRMRMHGLVLSLWRAHKPAVVLVTHDVAEAVELADRVLVLDDGRIASEERIVDARPREPHAAQALRERLLAHLGVGPRDVAGRASAPRTRAPTRNDEPLGQPEVATSP
ncbi:MAG: ABC transporter ATP-binding protein [Polyangiales bacterium]